MELIKALDDVTGRVLFLDSGEESEEWFRGRLRNWNSATIPEFILERSSFTGVVDLGPDHDGVGRWASNYGRHLFAFVR
jgi:hypothetical protein